jgi:hypothetical protein
MMNFKEFLNESIDTEMTGYDVMNYYRKYKTFKGLENLKIINNDFGCSHNQLTSFNGLVNLEEIKGAFYCTGNKLISFKGLEKLNLINKYMYCNFNKLNSFDGLKELKFCEFIEAKNNQLTSLKGLNKNIEIKNIYLEDNPIKIGLWIDDYKNLISKCRFDKFIQELINQHLNNTLIEKNKDLKFFIDNKQYFDQDYIDLINKYRGIDKQKHSEYDEF